MSDIQKVKELRRLTGAGFKDCNSALKESNGDLEKSIDWSYILYESKTR